MLLEVVRADALERVLPPLAEGAAFDAELGPAVRKVRSLEALVYGLERLI